jgi:hypothetical protein
MSDVLVFGIIHDRLKQNRRSLEVNKHPKVPTKRAYEPVPMAPGSFDMNGPKLVSLLEYYNSFNVLHTMSNITGALMK